MDLHLLWTNDGRMFIKPLPRYLLSPEFWIENLCCPPSCECKNYHPTEENSTNTCGSEYDTNPPFQECQRRKLQKCAMGFLYTYACLISYESDFTIAVDKHLMPQRSDGSIPRWEDWKKLVSEILPHINQCNIHPRFHRAELRLARLDTIHRFTQLPPFGPYMRGRRTYGSLFRDNLAWLATATVFIALVLTAMQVGLATDQLKENKSFMTAAYGFAIFAILGPLCGFGLVVVDAFYHLLTDLPWLLGVERKRNTVNRNTMNTETANSV